MITQGFGEDSIITRGMGSRLVQRIRREIIKMKSFIYLKLSFRSRV